MGEQDGLHAATPPLDALKMIISMAATVGKRMVSKETVVLINEAVRSLVDTSGGVRIRAGGRIVGT